MVGSKHITRKGRGRGSAGLARLRHEFHRFREEVGCIRSLPSLHLRWPFVARLEIDSDASSEDGTLWDSEEPPHVNFPTATADVETDGFDERVSGHSLQEFSHVALESSCNSHDLNQESGNVQTGLLHFDESSAEWPSDLGSQNTVVQFKSEHLPDLVHINPLLSQNQSAHSQSTDSTLYDIQHFEEGRNPVKPVPPCEVSARSQVVLETLQISVEVLASQRGNQEEEKDLPTKFLDGLGESEDTSCGKKSLEDLGNVGEHQAEVSGESLSACHVNQDLGEYNGEAKKTSPRYVDEALNLFSSTFCEMLEKDEGRWITYSSRGEGQTKALEDPSSLNDNSFTQLRSVEACTDDDIVGITVSHTGARIVATAYFTANPRQKPDEEEKEKTDDEKDTRLRDIPPNVSSVPLVKPMSPEDCNRTLKLVGYVYEEVQSKAVAQAPDQLISSETSSFPFSKVVQRLPVGLGNQFVRASIMPAGLDAQRQHFSIEAEEKTLNEDAPGPSQSHTTPITTASEGEVNGKLLKCQVDGVSSLIALTGLESFTKLGDDFKRDSELAVRMATRIRHALESVGERSRVNDRCMKGCDTKVTGHKSLSESGGFAVCRAPDGRGTSKVGKKLRFKTESDYPKPKVIGSRNCFSEGWFSCDVSSPAGRSSDSVRPEEPETYLQHVIAALDSGNESDAQVESDSQQELSNSSDEAPKKHDRSLRESPRSQRVSPKRHTEEGTKMCSFQSCNVEHDRRCAHGRFYQLHRTGRSSCLFHTPVRPCCHSEVQEEISEQGHASNGCSGSPNSTCVTRRFAKTHGGLSNVARNSVDGTAPANPQAFSVKINGSMVEIEVGAEPPSIVWTPRGQNDQAVAVRTSSYQTQEQNTTVDANTESYGAATPSSGRYNSTRILPGVSDFTDANRMQTNDDHPVVRFRDPTLPGKVSKSVSFHSAAKDGHDQYKFYSQKQIHDRFDRTVKSLGRKAQGLGEIEATGEAEAGSQHSLNMQGRLQANGVRIPPEVKSKTRLSVPSPESHFGLESLDNQIAETPSGKNRHGVVVPVAGNTQGEEPSRSILKSSRGASESDSEVQDHGGRGRHGTQVTDSTRHSAVAVPFEMKLRRPKRRPILKNPGIYTSPSTRHDCARGVYDDEVSNADDRKEILEAAAAGLANEVQILMKTRSREHFKGQEERQDGGSSASEVSGYRQKLRTQRPKKLPGHFRSRNQAIPSQERPGFFKELTGDTQFVYHSTHLPHTSAPKNRRTGHFRSNYQAGSSDLPSEYQNEPFGHFRLFNESRELKDGTSVLASGKGRGRFVDRETPRNSQINSASMRRAKQIVRETLGDVFDYDQFEQELGELVSERRKMELLSRSLSALNPDAVKLRQKQGTKQGTLGLERTFNPRPARDKETGSSGTKRHRSAISPLGKSGKKMFRSVSGKRAIPIESNADNHDQLLLYLANRHDASYDATKTGFFSLGGSKFSAHNIVNKMQKSGGLPMLPHASISRRPPHKLVTEFKNCVKETGFHKSCEISSLEKNYVNLTLLEGGESDRLLGDQLAIKRKSLRPPGSIFKVATPVIWFPGGPTSNKGAKLDLPSASIMETSGHRQAAVNYELKPKNENVTRRNGEKEAEKIVSRVSQGPRVERRSSHDAERPERHIPKISVFSSDSRKWPVTISPIEINCEKDNVLKSELVGGRSKATQPKACGPKTDARAAERQSWSERMKAFLLSCGALLTETNISKCGRHSKQPRFITRLDVGDDEGRFLLERRTFQPVEKKEGLISIRLPKIVNNPAKKLHQRTGRWHDSTTDGELISGPGTTLINEKVWGAPKRYTEQRYGKSESCKNLLAKKKFGKSVIGQQKGHDPLLTMLNKVSTGISKQKQMVKTKSLQDASARKTKVPDSLYKNANALVSLRGKGSARLPTTNRAKEGINKGPKKLRFVEVKGAQVSTLLCRRKESNDISHMSLREARDVKNYGAENQDNSLKGSRNMEASLMKRGQDLVMQFVNRGTEASVENWLNASGGFEFLDRAHEDQQDSRKPHFETGRKYSDPRSSSDRTSLHSWSVRSTEVRAPEAFASVSAVNENIRKEKGSQDSISLVTCMDVQSSSLLHGKLHKGREEVHATWNVNAQVFQGESSGMDRDTGRNDSSSLHEVNLQPLESTDFDSDPVDSFIHLFQEYREKSEGGRMMHGVTGGGKSSLVDVGTEPSLDAEDQLTEGEELELALLELEIKTVLRDDLIRNAKSGAITKEETPALVTNQRKPESCHVDHGVQALVLNLLHDVKQLSPTPQVSDSAKSSCRAWPDYTCLAEKQSRSESCEEDGDWPEYSGLDDQARNVEEPGEIHLPLTEHYSEKVPELGTLRGPSSMIQPSHSSTTFPPFPLPTNTSESNNAQSIQLPGLSSLAFPCAPPPRSKESASYTGNRSSTGVQTTDLSVGLPLNSVYVLPLYCLPDGRPLLTPYPVYPNYPVPEGPSRISPMQTPSAVQSLQSHATTAAVSEVVRRTSTGDMPPSRTKEFDILNSEDESRLLIERHSSSSTSSDTPHSSPRTPSTPISSPEHEARVALAIARHRRRHKLQVLPCSSGNIDASPRQNENEDTQIQRSPDYQELPALKQEPLALARNLPGGQGQEEYPLQVLTTCNMEDPLSCELVPRSVSAASASSSKELEVRPFVYYDDTESSEPADSYDGSDSSGVSVHPRMYSGLDLPFTAQIAKGLEKQNRPPITPAVTGTVNDTRAESPGESQHFLLASGRQAHGLKADLGRDALESHVMYRENDLTRLSGLAGELNLQFSEGEIDPGGLRSEGECGRMYSSVGILHQNLLYSDHEDRGDVSESGEVNWVADQNGTGKSNSMEKSNLIESLSEGEIRAGISKQD